eukprot:4395878-Amphidinium_carterae.1
MGMHRSVLPYVRRLCSTVREKKVHCKDVCRRFCVLVPRCSYEVVQDLHSLTNPGNSCELFGPEVFECGHFLCSGKEHSKLTSQVPSGIQGAGKPIARKKTFALVEFQVVGAAGESLPMDKPQHMVHVR